MYHGPAHLNATKAAHLHNDPRVSKAVSSVFWCFLGCPSIMELFSLEKAAEIIEFKHYSSSAKAATKPCPQIP